MVNLVCLNSWHSIRRLYSLLRKYTISDKMTTNLPDIDLTPPHPQVTTLVNLPRSLRYRRSTFDYIESLNCRLQPIVIALPTVPEDTVRQADLVSFGEFVELQAVCESLKKIINRVLTANFIDRLTNVVSNLMSLLL